MPPMSFAINDYTFSSYEPKALNPTGGSADIYFVTASGTSTRLQCRDCGRSNAKDGRDRDP